MKHKKKEKTMVRKRDKKTPMVIRIPNEYKISENN